MNITLNVWRQSGADDKGKGERRGETMPRQPVQTGTRKTHR